MPAFFRLALTTVAVKSLLPHNPLVRFIHELASILRRDFFYSEFSF